MSTRRRFMLHAGLVASGLMFKPSNLFSKSYEHAGIDKVGLQLYTLREAITKDAKGTLQKVAQTGYKEVETFGFSKENHFWGLKPAQLLEVLKQNGLTSPSGHYMMSEFLTPEAKTDELKLQIEAAQVLGQQYITVPALGGEIRQKPTVDQYKFVAERFNKAAEICKQSNVTLAYHNHSFEFIPIEGKTGYEILLKETDPALVKFEMDLFWTVKSSIDPVEMMKQNPGRFVMLHVKDMDKTNPDVFTEVGKGRIKFKEIFTKTGLQGIEHIFVEQDKITIDPFVSIQESYKFVKSIL